MRYEVFQGLDMLFKNDRPMCPPIHPGQHFPPPPFGEEFMHHGMHHCHHNGTPFRILLFFGEDELLQEISNLAFVQGDIARVHDNYGHDILGDSASHYMHQFKDICDSGNLDRVRRIISASISEVEQMLYKYTRYGAEMPISIDNREEDKVEYLIELKMSKPFSDTTAWNYLRTINEYIVSSVLEDWASITYPEGMPTWSQKKAKAGEKIAHLSHYTVGSSNRVKQSII